MPATKQLSLGLPADLMDKVKKDARENERSTAAQIRIILREWYDAREAQVPSA